MLGAVININTIDEVKGFGGYTDIGIFSTSALVKSQIKRDINGDIFFQGPYTNNEESTDAGYLIVSGRVGYMSVFVPIIVRLFTDINDLKLPEYWDYQFKGKFYFDSKNSITLLLIGSKDWFKMSIDEDLSDEDGVDPLVGNFDFDYDQSFHNQGISYKHESDNFKNTLSAYSSISEHYQYMNIGNVDAADWAKDYSMSSKPNIFGVREEFSFEWLKKISTLRGNIEYTLYDFEANGKEIFPTSGNGIDLADENAVISIPLNTKYRNHTISGYLENKLKYAGLTFVPGIRLDYLKRSNEFTNDLRGLLSYEFSTETTISVSSAQYSSFYQTNPNYFKSNPSIGEIDIDTKPEKAWHNVVGLEQKVNLFVFSVEYFQNKFYDLGVSYPHYVNGEYSQGASTGEMKTSGVEVMIRKDSKPSENGLFGWLSYTFTQSKTKSGILGNRFNGDGSDSGELFDPNGDTFLSSNYEQVHSFKLVSGYRYNSHSISGRFQFYTSTPYTPIIGNKTPTNVNGQDRYAPLYSTSVNSVHFEPSYRLDLRYSYKTSYKWGHISWYIEVINVTMHQAADNVEWKYDKPYQDGENPVIQASSDGLPFIPNFGVEVKF